AAARGKAVAHQVIGRVLAGAREEPRVKPELTNEEPLVVRRDFRAAAAHKRHDLNRVAFAELSRSVVCGRHDFAIYLDGDRPAILPERFEQLRDGERIRKRARFAIQCDGWHSVILCAPKRTEPAAQARGAYALLALRAQLIALLLRRQRLVLLE